MASFKGWLIEALYDYADEIRDTRRQLERRGAVARSDEMKPAYFEILDEITRRNIRSKRRGRKNPIERHPPPRL